jgi:hypothetical protein
MDTKTLEEEVQHFREEKEKIRMIVGRIGGAQSAKREQFITTILWGGNCRAFCRRCTPLFSAFSHPLSPIVFCGSWATPRFPENDVDDAQTNQSRTFSILDFEFYRISSQ